MSPSNEAGITPAESVFPFCELEEAPWELSVTRVSGFSKSNQQTRIRNQCSELDCQGTGSFVNRFGNGLSPTHKSSTLSD